MIRDQLIAMLDRNPGGLSSQALLERTELRSDPYVIAAVDSFLLLSSEVKREGNLWKLIGQSRTAKILSAIDAYAKSTGKKIFRLSTALEGLPAHEHPTEEELIRALKASNGQYKLLPNAMIKRNS
jgi:hypothetical protein